jgi:hypothetical protein
MVDLRKITMQMQLRTSAIRVAAAVDLIDFSDWGTAGVGRSPSFICSLSR